MRFQKIVIIGWNGSQDDYGALVFHKTKYNEDQLNLQEMIVQIKPQPTYILIKSQIARVIGSFHQKQAIYGFGIMGFHRFLQGYYITYVTEIEPIAKIGRHRIFKIKETAILPLFDLKSDKKTKKNQEKYFEILSAFKPEHFYFSNTYDMTNSLSKNMIRNSKVLFGFEEQNIVQSFIKDEKQMMKKKQRFLDQQIEAPPLKEKKSTKDDKILQTSQIFLFNMEMLKQFNQSVRNKKFIIPMIHGYCKHINVDLKGTQFNVIVIARRCRHHAGTRYIKRGIDSHGFVANFVQVEQIVVNYTSSQDTRPVCSSFIQVRGSVPTYWMQRPSIHIPKPIIQLKPDDYMYLATRKHFSDLTTRYGAVIYAINLMKTKEKNPRQCVLSQEYQIAVSFVNREDLPEQNQIHYLQIDMKYHLRLDKKMFVSKIKTIAYFSLLKTGMFLCFNHSNSSHEQYVEIQNGIIRANCVDCLDRTNSFQQLVGETALAVQLNRLIKEKVSFSGLELSEKIMDEYGKLYEEMGDLISIQYGSSLAHKQKIQKSTESRFEFLIAITRHVNNNWNDYDRQEQLDVFLGYKPEVNGPQLWDSKPSIEHYADKSLNRMQFGNWYRPAYDQFKKQHYIKEFHSINNQFTYQKSLPQFQKFGKQDLVNKFTSDIVNSLINDKQIVQKFQFFVMPKIIHKTKFWRDKNPKSKAIQTLKDQLGFCYNKRDYGGKPISEMDKRAHQHSQDSPIVSSKRFKSQTPQQSNRNKFPSNRLKPSLSFFTEDKNLILRNVQKAVQGDPFDDNQAKILERYLLGELIEDEQIQRLINEYLNFINSDIEKDWPSDFDIQRQIRTIEIGIQNKSYINLAAIDNFDKVSLNLLRTRKKTIIDNSATLKQLKIQEKNQKMKENKILILEQIMKKNFSHGNIQKIQQI